MLEPDIGVDPINVAAAIQAASLISDYRLAIAFVRDHGLGDVCVGCAGTDLGCGVRWTLDDSKFALGIFATCAQCSEAFARWFTEHYKHLGAPDLHPVGYAIPR